MSASALIVVKAKGSTIANILIQFITDTSGLGKINTLSS